MNEFQDQNHSYFRFMDSEAQRFTIWDAGDMSLFLLQVSVGKCALYHYLHLYVYATFTLQVFSLPYISFFSDSYLCGQASVSFPTLKWPKCRNGFALTFWSIFIWINDLNILWEGAVWALAAAWVLAAMIATTMPFICEEIIVQIGMQRSVCLHDSWIGRYLIHFRFTSKYECS